MSRGLGVLQRKILAALEPDKLLSILELAARTHGPTITKSEYELVRRAVHALEKRELIGRTWWYMFFVAPGPMRYGLPHAVDRCEEFAGKVLDKLERQRIATLVTVGRAIEPTVTDSTS
jgi:hypothetical protein